MRAEVSESRALSGEMKAAVLLMTLGEDLSTQLIQNLPKDSLRKVASSIANLSVVSKEEVHTVLLDAMSMVEQRTGEVRADAQYARRLVSRAAGTDAVTEILEQVASTGNKGLNLEQLSKADPKKLLRFLSNEHPQTVALILAQMRRSKAAPLLGALPEKMRVDVAVRLAELQSVPLEIVDQVAGELGKKLGGSEVERKEPFQGAKAVAELMNQLEGAACDEFLTMIGKVNVELADQIRDAMFVFDDIMKLDNSAIKEILGKVDRKVLTVALKGTHEALRKHFLGAMSQRGGAMMLEDIEAMGPMKVKDIEDAQRQVILVIRALDRDGVISLRGGGQDYVV